MTSLDNIFQIIQSKYQKNKIDSTITYYFKIGEGRYTLFAHPESCELKEGKAVDKADCVIISDAKVFENLIMHGKKPGKMDLLRGKFKPSDLGLLMKLQDLFGLKIS